MSWINDRRFALRRAAAMISDRPGGFVIATLLTASALALPLFVAVLGYSALPWGPRVQQSAGPEANVFVTPGTSANDVEALKNQLGRVAGVSGVRLVPRDAALADLAKRGGLTLPADRANPLPDVLVVRFPAGTELTAIDRALADIKPLAGVDRVRADVDWYRRARTLAIALGSVVIVLAGFVASLLFFVMIAAAREQVNVRREEIAVMRLCGATSAFMARPYVYLSAAAMGVGVVLAAAAVSGAVAWVRPYLVGLADVVGQPVTLRLPPLWTLAVIFIIAVVLGALAGWVGSRRAIRRPLAS